MAKPRSVDGNSWMILDTSSGRFNKRVRLILLVIFILVIALVLRLVWVQFVASSALSEQAQQQRTAVIVEPAKRGTITDRNGPVAVRAPQQAARIHAAAPRSLPGYRSRTGQADR